MRIGHRASRLDDIVAEVFPVLDCAVCGYDKCKAAIDFRHLDPKEKDFFISDARGSNFSKEKLIAELNWDKNDIECLIFISQTPDYKLPATACVLHGKSHLLFTLPSSSKKVLVNFYLLDMI